MIVGLSGTSGSGKDTCAEAPFFNDYVKIAFAGPLKLGCKELFDLDNEQLHDRTKKETIDERWGKSPREIFQWMGTDVLRKINEDFFIIQTESRIKKIVQQNPGAKIIVTDSRFDNEAKLIKKLGGVIINISRPNNSDQTIHKNHASEQEISSDLVDIWIKNDSTIDMLHEKVRAFMNV